MPGVVVVGAGQAGCFVVASLRAQGYQGPVTLLGDEGRLPDSRPPLSKAFLAGEMTEDRMLLRPADFYQKADIRVLAGTPATRIDRQQRRVELADGSALPYGSVVIATGGSPRRLPLAGAEAPNVHYVRRIEDVESLRSALLPQARLVVVGGGYVGLEVAALARTMDVQVTVVEAAGRLLARVAGPEVAAFVHQRHRRHGIDIRLNATVSGFGLDADGRVERVEVGGGESLAADVVVVGIGLVPHVSLAEECGLVVDDGILVDEFCRTADESVYALGDCARHPCAEHGGLRRLESVANATDQARVVASAIVGRPEPYRAVPWFWSDQADLKLKSVGLATACDTTIVLEPSRPGEFAVLHLKEGRIRAADVVNNPRLFTTCRKLVAQRVPATRELLTDPQTVLDSLL